MARRHAPAAAANREALLAVLRRALPRGARVLELGSGTGEHAAFFAARLPGVAWQPSDPDPESRASIEAWTLASGARGVAPPLALDLLAPAWRLRRADAIVCVNVLQVAPPLAALALVEGAQHVLAPGGALVVAGPFRRRAAALPPALASFEAALQARGGGQGLRELEALVEAAERADLGLEETVPLPDDCVCAVFRRR